MRLIVEEDSQAVGAFTAAYIKHRINEFAPTADRPFVLGLPTGAHLEVTVCGPLPPSKRPLCRQLPSSNLPEARGIPQKGRAFVPSRWCVAAVEHDSGCLP